MKELMNWRIRVSRWQLRFNDLATGEVYVMQGFMTRWGANHMAKFVSKRLARDGLLYEVQVERKEEER